MQKKNIYIYIILESLCCTSETNIILYINYISIKIFKNSTIISSNKKERKKKERKEKKEERKRKKRKKGRKKERKRKKERRKEKHRNLVNIYILPSFWFTSQKVIEFSFSLRIKTLEIFLECITYLVY